MLKQTLLFSKILELGYSFFNSFKFFHVPLSASLYHDLSCCSQSECFSQKSRSIFFAITLNYFLFRQRYKLVPKAGNFIKIFLGLFETNLCQH